MCLQILTKAFVLLGCAVFLCGFFEGGGSSGLDTKKNRMSVHYQLYSNDRNNGFTSRSTSYGLEIAKMLNSSSVLSYLVFIRGVYSSGTESFLDGSTERNLTFVSYAVQPHIGLHANLLPRDSSTFNLYIGAHGGFGYHFLQYSNSSSLTELKKSYSSFGYGYEYVAGTELSWKGKDSKTSAFFAEIQLRFFTATLANVNPYHFDGIGFSAGYLW